MKRLEGHSSRKLHKHCEGRWRPSDKRLIPVERAILGDPFLGESEGCFSQMVWNVTETKEVEWWSSQGLQLVRRDHERDHDVWRVVDCI